MAIVSADVTYTVNTRKGAGGGRYKVQATVGWPSGLTYDRGGIPINKLKLGFRTKIEMFTAMDPVTTTADVFRYDVSNESLVAYGVAHTSDVGHIQLGITPQGLTEVSSGDTLLSHTLDVHAEGHN